MYAAREWHRTPQLAGISWGAVEVHVHIPVEIVLHTAAVKLQKRFYKYIQHLYVV
jgi:hypothetical protein